jgi:EAL domain-containing protein (putative c-di-GMP-specific phosphodiesterase class I)/GGDEF domain-containing protein
MLSDDVRHALLELVERGLAEAGTLRALASEGHRLLMSKSELLALLDGRIGTPGLCVTAGTLTNLAVINQIYGFAIGDLLQELARSTAALVLGEIDPSARMAQIAGAQFVIVHGTSDRDQARATVRRLQQACNTVALSRHHRSVVPRVAMVSLEVPRVDGINAAEILKILGYSQLRSRPSHLEPVFLDHEVDHERWRASLHLREQKASRITDALRNDGVEIHFQPVIELTTRNLHNVEVLARIRTDDGLMTATEFIESVYQLGEIVELDSQVFERLGEAAPKLAGITGHLFINVSPVSLLSSEFRELMSRTMQGLAAEGLGMVMVLELTEQAIVEHLDIIQELHTRHDVKFAVDDFGTGYSSLKTLSDLAVSRVISHLKLDGSLVRELETSGEAYKVVLAIANLARSLDLKVVAEHVESEAILERLRTIGVELGQGKLFDMPLSLPGLVEEYRDRHTTTAPTSERPDLEVLVPYLDRTFAAFYDRLLSSDHFRSFFRDEDQIRDLVQRQRSNFIASMADDDDALRERYVELGRLHHQLGVPFPSFMTGAEMLDDELLGVLAHAADQGQLIYRSSRFFKRLKSLLARGYLDGAVAREEADLASALNAITAALGGVQAPSLSWIGELLTAVHLDRFESPPRPSLSIEEATQRLEERIAPLLTKDSAQRIVQAYRDLHADGESLAFFLDRQEYGAVVMLYRQLHDRVGSLLRSLSDAGIA